MAKLVMKSEVTNLIATLKMLYILYNVKHVLNNTLEVHAQNFV